MKCAFCGADLYGSLDMKTCLNEDCVLYIEVMPTIVWQALISGKVAQDFLSGIGKILFLDTNKPTVLTIKGKQEIRRRITSITKQENE